MNRTGKYYNWDRLLGYYPQGYRIFISVGQGGIGKTYSAMQTCKNRCTKKAERKMLLVRDAENVLDAFNSEDGKATLEKHFCKPGEAIKMEKDDLWLCDKVTETRTAVDDTEYEAEKLVKKRHLGSMAALSTFYKQKGIERAQAGYDTIFIDEFIQESRQADRVDTVRAFFRTLQSTLRLNPDAVVMMAANLVNESPLWNILECKPGKPGEITYCAKTGVVIEHSTPTEEWVEANAKSVAGRLGIDDYKKDKDVNPSIKQAHKERGFDVQKLCYHLTNDGADQVYVFETVTITPPTATTSYSERRFKYVASKETGEILVNKYKTRGLKPFRLARVPTFGFDKVPKSKFTRFGNLVNDMIFESKNTLEKFEKIVK